MTGRPPKTVRQYLSAIKEFLIFYDIEISAKDTRKIRQRMPKGGAVTVQKDLDPETLRSILSHLDLKMRALILLLASSGLRIGEALVLELEDITVAPDRTGGVIIRGETEKNRRQRYTFCSPEASNAILEWVKNREEYIRTAAARGNGLGILKHKEDKRLFPFSDNVVYVAWDRALKKAGLHSQDRKTGRIQLNIHLLRAFFTSQMKLAVPSDIVEMLAGHSGYLSDAYRRYTKKQALEFYEKGVPYVTVMVPGDIRDLQTNMRERMEKESEIVRGVVAENIELKKALDAKDVRLVDIERRQRATELIVADLRKKNISSPIEKV